MKELRAFSVSFFAITENRVTESRFPEDRITRNSSERSLNCLAELLNLFEQAVY